MRPLLIAIVLSVTGFGAPASGPAPRREIDNVATFARLYGVVRYFYPSDAAASLDWNPFAVYGVKQARAALDARGLETTFKALFGPLGPGIEIGQRLPTSPALGNPDTSLIAWRYLGAGVAESNASSPYKAKRTHRSLPVDLIPHGPQFLGFWPPHRPVSNAELFESAPTNGAHVDIDLGLGLKARVPLALSEAQARGDPNDSSKFDVLRAALGLVPASSEGPDVDARLAGILVAWNVFRHFYPYWTESGVDWDSRLRPQLELAYVANGRDAQRDALRQLVADASDGHGSVVDTRRAGERVALPIQLGIIDDRLVVTASDVSGDIPVGSVVSTIDGVPAAQRVAATVRLTSGTPQWKRARALWEITSCPKGPVIKLVVDSGTGPHRVSLHCDAKPPPLEKRPEAVAELTPGIWYVDLTRSPMTQVRPLLQKLANAIGVVFDVRGYPTDAGAGILRNLIDAAESDRWMHVAKITGPFGQSDGWQSLGWNLRPSSPRLAGKIVFLTDGRAISYAESVMGYVADRKLGTIVGSTTAGTNGNVAMFAVPGEFNVTFTGMRVTGHDGRTPHHLIGIKPDIFVAPTLAALKEGRDEVLDRALALIGGK